MNYLAVVRLKVKGVAAVGLLREGLEGHLVGENVTRDGNGLALEPAHGDGIDASPRLGGVHVDGHEPHVKVDPFHRNGEDARPVRERLARRVALALNVHRERLSVRRVNFQLDKTKQSKKN